MTSRKVENPNAKGNSGFLWALVVVAVIGAIILGYVVISGQNQQDSAYEEYQVEDISVEPSLEESTIVLADASATADTPRAEVYEDFSCSYCATLAEETDEDMLEAIDDGELVVELRPLNFMDSGTQGHSTNALAATLALADRGEWEAYLSLRNVLFGEQQNAYNQWDAERMGDIAESVGASREAANAIRDGEYLEQADAMGTANAEWQQEQTGQVSSPRVLVNGDDVTNQGAADIYQWVDWIREV